MSPICIRPFSPLLSTPTLSSSLSFLLSSSFLRCSPSGRCFLLLDCVALLLFSRQSLNSSVFSDQPGRSSCRTRRKLPSLSSTNSPPVRWLVCLRYVPTVWQLRLRVSVDLCCRIAFPSVPVTNSSLPARADPGDVRLPSKRESRVIRITFSRKDDSIDKLRCIGTHWTWSRHECKHDPIGRHP